jgi:hypothetical protein
MTPQEELELLRLRKQKAMAAKARPAFTGAAERTDEDRKLFDSLNPVERLFLGLGKGSEGVALTLQDLAARATGGQRVDPATMAERERLTAPLSRDFLGSLGEQIGVGVHAVPAGIAAAAAGTAALPAWAAAAAPALGSGIEGLVGNALMSAPGQQGESARTGLALGLGIPTALRATGAALRATAGQLPGAVRAAGQSLGDIIRGGYVKPTPEARRLMDEGAELTLGQMHPNSLFGRAEEIGANSVVGTPLTMERARADVSVRDTLMRKAAPPGVTPPTAGAPIPQQLEELRAGFGQLYEGALADAKLHPESYMGRGKWRGLLTDETLEGAGRTKGAFDLAANDRNIDATPETRRRALEWLTDQANALMPTKSGPNAGTVDASAIHALRTRLRDRLRGLSGQGDDRALKEIYGKAEGFVTELLEGQLPPERAEMLRAADHAYGNVLSAEKAAKTTKNFVNNHEFAPRDLLTAILKKGSTPELYHLTRDAHEVLNPTYPMNGIQGVAPAAIPFFKQIGPAWALAANSLPSWRQHALMPRLPVPQNYKSLADLLPSQRNASLMSLLRPQEEDAPPWAMPVMP